MTSRPHSHAVETTAVIRPLVGEFADGVWEQAFRESTLAYVAPQQRISLVVWAVLELVVAVIDYFFFGPVLQFWYSLSIVWPLDRCCLPVAWRSSANQRWR